MRITTNAAIIKVVAAHVKLDARIEQKNNAYRRAAEQPIYRDADLGEHVQARVAASASRTCQRVVALGSGLGRKTASKVASAEVYERLGLPMMTRHQSGGLLHLAGTASVLAVKLALFHLGTLVLAPLVGLACGLAAWGRAEPVAADPDGRRNYGPELRPARLAGRGGCTSAQTALAMNRHHQRTAEAVSPLLEAAVKPLFPSPLKASLQ